MPDDGEHRREGGREQHGAARARAAAQVPQAVGRLAHAGPDPAQAVFPVHQDAGEAVWREAGGLAVRDAAVEQLLWDADDWWRFCLSTAGWCLAFFCKYFLHGLGVMGSYGFGTSLLYGYGCGHGYG